MDAKQEETVRALELSLVLLQDQALDLLLAGAGATGAPSTVVGLMAAATSCGIGSVSTEVDGAPSTADGIAWVGALRP